MQDRNPRKGSLLRWLASFIVSEWSALGLVMALSIIAVTTSIAQPYLTRSLIDDGILKRDQYQIVHFGELMVGLAILRMSVGFCCRRLHTAASLRILHRMREELFARLLHLSPTFFAKASQGDLLSRLETDLGEVQRFAVESGLSVVNALLTFAGSVVLLSVLSARLAAVVSVLLAVNLSVLARIKPRVAELAAAARASGVRVSAFLVEKLAAVRCIQTFCAERTEQDRLADLHSDVRKRMLALQMFGYFGGALPNFLLSIAIISIFVGGTLGTFGGEALTLGTLVAFTSCIQRVVSPVHSLMGQYLQWQRVKVSLARIDEARRFAPAVTESMQAVRMPPDSTVEIRDLGYCYGATRASALANMNLRLQGGGKVLIRGPSGCGKSTLADLFQRFMDPTSGGIRIGGHEVRQIALPELRAAVITVGEEPTLFAGTIFENIRYGKPDANPAEVVAAARIAAVTDFAQHIPLGLQADVGTRGGRLSAGERQRVAIARALLRRPSILIIDEGLCNVDRSLEAKILASIDEWLPNSLRVVISHREMNASEFDVIHDMTVAVKPEAPCVLA